ncbi:hypothetical protein BD769DRAFT_1778954 [Suillus cothurnatus]|nr:hypothetical protein BD769DRAFT_1778954 [Suillus cothurnatus]
MLIPSSQHPPFPTIHGSFLALLPGPPSWPSLLALPPGPPSWPSLLVLMALFFPGFPPGSFWPSSSLVPSLALHGSSLTLPGPSLALPGSSLAFLSGPPPWPSSLAFPGGSSFVSCGK